MVGGAGRSGDGVKHGSLEASTAGGTLSGTSKKKRREKERRRKKKQREHR